MRPDGTISLGIYGSVYVAGSTLRRGVRDAVAAQIHVSVNKLSVDDIKKGLVADVLAYNSKVYYVITDGAGYGEQVYPIAVTGNETVLDAMSKINGLPPAASKKRIWVARATPHCDHPEILPVDWCGITQQGCADTNYQIFPGDRIYVASDPWLRTDSFLAKRLNPIEAHDRDRSCWRTATTGQQHPHPPLAAGGPDRKEAALASCTRDGGGEQG